MRRILLLTTVLLAACGKAESHDDAGAPPCTSDAGTPVVDSGGGDDLAAAKAMLEAWDLKYLTAICERSVRCAPENGPRFTSMEACLKGYDQTAFDRYNTGGASLSWQARMYDLADAAVQQACLDALATNDCAAFTDPAACDRVRIAKMPLPIGAPCGKGVCGPEATCGTPDSESCLTTICVAKPPLPEPMNLAKLGEPCATPLADCRPGLYCVAADGQMTCRPALAEGARCNTSNTPLCLAGLFCKGAIDGVCRPPEGIVRGGVCPRVAEACQFTDWCVFDTPDAPTGRCGIPPEIDGDEPCTASFYKAGDCPYAKHAEGREPGSAPSNDYCICRARVPDGGPCRTHDACLSRRCSVDDSFACGACVTVTSPTCP